MRPVTSSKTGGGRVRRPQQGGWAGEVPFSVGQVAHGDAAAHSMIAGQTSSRPRGVPTCRPAGTAGTRHCGLQLAAHAMYTWSSRRCLKSNLSTTSDFEEVSELCRHDGGPTVAGACRARRRRGNPPPIGWFINSGSPLICWVSPTLRSCVVQRQASTVELI